MTEHEIDPRAVKRVLEIATNHVKADPFLRPGADVRGCSLSLLRAALLVAFPAMDAAEIALLMSVDDAERYRREPTRLASLWYTPVIIDRMADVLNPDRIPVRPQRQPKPLPLGFVTTPDLPLCGPKCERAVEVVRTRARMRRERVPGPIRTAAPWDPPEARQARPALRQRPLPASVMGDPAEGRSALDARRRDMEKVGA